jgi:hypothetical protein
MPVQNTQGAFSLGRDCTVILLDDSYGQVQIDNITSFDCNQTTQAVNVDRLDGVQLQADVPKGWHGTFNSERGGPSLDAYFSSVEDAWFSSGQINTKTLYQYITEPDGSQTTIQFDNVSVTFTNAGNWMSDRAVKLTVTFRANRRIVL